MDLLSYIFVKPFLLLLETIFTVLGRIIGTQVSITLSFLAGLMFYVPFYILLKQFQSRWISNTVSKADPEGNKKNRTWKDYAFFIIGVISPSISQILILFSVFIFVRENNYVEGAKFLFLTDLSKPDGLIETPWFSVNILPIAYLFINAVLLFLNKKKISFKIITFSETAILTILLYRLPSGTALFWLLFTVCCAVVETAKWIYGLFQKNNIIPKTLLKTNNKKTAERNPDALLFFSGLFFLILMSGYFIPTNIIKVSTQEFVDVTALKNPMHFVLYSMALSIGMFGLWGSGCYLLSNRVIKTILERIVCVLVVAAAVDYLFSGSYQGEISSELTYFDPKEFDTGRIIFSSILILVLSVAVLILTEKKKEFMKLILFAQLGVLLVSVIINTIRITGDYSEMSYINEENSQAEITLSKNGKNVIVIIADRALGPVVPFLFEEKPELKEQFDGFVYYPNTVSFAAYTNTGIPSVYGGYEYTPEEMNARPDESLAEKHNEALKVLPVLFAENDFNVTLIDPAYAGYNWIPDLSIFDECSNTKAYNLEGTFSNQYPDDYVPQEEQLKRNFFYHAVLKMFPLNWQDLLYDGGNYCDLNGNQCVRSSKYTQNGYYSNFMKTYYVLKNLPDLTRVEENGENFFVSLYNATPHMECLLQEPDYVPKKKVDNRSYHPDKEPEYRIGERYLYMFNSPQVEFYHVDMATFLMLGEWFDYLRSNDCYDNTRIIIVADHGAGVEHFDSVLENNMDVENFMPVLLVKDFDSHGFMESGEIMTNADTPGLAVEGLISDPRNPFTGNLLDGHEKEEMSEFHIFYSEENTLRMNHGNTFLPGLWYSLKGSPYNLSNWNYLGKY
ncbi:MAG: hypothetical protein IJH82_00340 [Lachnospiraceae bacterium]|nr:hypothetical protein [Lachnospiraceae bacterium]